MPIYNNKSLNNKKVLNTPRSVHFISERTIHIHNNKKNIGIYILHIGLTRKKN